MRIIAVDDEPHALRDLAQGIEAAAPGVQVAAFSCPEEALAYARQTPVDVAFLDIEMGKMDGIQLAQQLKLLVPHMNIIFATGYGQYMGSAFSLHASGYVLKPVRAEHIAEELYHLRHPVRPKAGRPIRVRCFGTFDVFVEGRPLTFSRAKPKELLAYLVDRRGATVSAAKIAATLWEDKSYDRSLQKQTQTVISQLMRALREMGIDDIIVKGWNNIAVDTTKFACDYYDFLSGDVSALNLYEGVYLADYSWAEMTTGLLSRAVKK